VQLQSAASLLIINTDKNNSQYFPHPEILVQLSG
jgi:hypothetical protein